MPPTHSTANRPILTTISQCFADGVEVWAFCEAEPARCLRNVKLDLPALIDRYGDIRVRELRRRLRCQACGGKSLSIRLVSQGGAPR